MKQSIFIIRHDFFDNPTAGKEFVKKLVIDNCKSEKLALVFDPLAENFFTHVAKNNRDMFFEIVRDFYNYWEESNDALPLKWYQLDELATFHITFLSPIIYEMDDRDGSYLIGCLPLLHYDPNMYVYFMMSTYDIEDVFLLIDGKKYMEVLETYINRFNSSVFESKKGKKIVTEQKKAQISTQKED